MKKLLAALCVLLLGAVAIDDHLDLLNKNPGPPPVNYTRIYGASNRLGWATSDGQWGTLCMVPHDPQAILNLDVNDSPAVQVAKINAGFERLRVIGAAGR